MIRIDIESALKEHEKAFSWSLLDAVLSDLSCGKAPKWQSSKITNFFSANELASPDFKDYFSLLLGFHREKNADGKKIGIYVADPKRIQRWVDIYGVYMSARGRALEANKRNAKSYVENVLDKCADYCVKYLFDYEKFSAANCLDKHKNGSLYWRNCDWGAASYIAKTGFKSCVYCNDGIVDQSGTHHTALDHYFAKDKYPFLALSLYNLIPACDKCNKAKSNGSYDITLCAHPMIDDVHTLSRFDVHVLNPRVFVGKGKEDDVDITLEPRSFRGRYAQTLKLCNGLGVEDHYRKFCRLQAVDMIALIHGMDNASLSNLLRLSKGNYVSPQFLRERLGFTPSRELIRSENRMKFRVDVVSNRALVGGVMERLLTDITVIILTGKEELHIGRCLEKLAPLEPRQIIVVESQKGDRTHEIALAHGATCVWHDWPGLYAKQFNWALDNCLIESKWILRLDADEYLTPETIEKLKAELPRMSEDVAGINLELKRRFCGCEIRHATNGIRLLRIWRAGRGRSEERAMDEHIEVDGKVIDFDGAFYDDNLNDMDWWREKHRGYAKREAADALAFARGEIHFKPAKEAYYRMPRYLRAFIYFAIRYFLKGGFLDGYGGWMWNFWQGLWYRCLVDYEIGEFKRTAK